MMIGTGGGEGSQVGRDQLADVAGPTFDPAAFVASNRPLTMGGFLLSVCDRYADNECLVFDDPMQAGATVRWTYADLEREARAIAGALIATGITPGDRVATLMANRPEAVAAYFGAAMSGGVVVPLSTFATRDELGRLLSVSEAKVVLLQTTMGKRDFAADIASIRAENPVSAVALGPQDAAAGLTTWGDFLAIAEDAAAVESRIAATDPLDDGLIIFSSGTTADPKGMLHHHQAATLQFWLQSQLFGRHEATRMWTALPLF